MQTMENQTSRVLTIIRKWGHWHEIQCGAEKEYALSQAEFERLLPEYQKFIGLIALGYCELGMLSADVDKIWHAHILNTVLYAQFCNAVCGRMIHHMPNLGIKTAAEHMEHKDPEPTCAERGFYSLEPTNAVEYFRHAYFSAYGEMPSEIWGLSEADGRVLVQDSDASNLATRCIAAYGELQA